MEKIILLADDDSDDAEVFGEVLSEIDPKAKFLHALNGSGVFEHIGHPSPDLIFLDLNMPEMDGWQCLSKLKTDPDTKNIPVIIYSTSNWQGDKLNAIKSGASAFVTKPSDYNTLRRLLTAITSNIGKDIGASIRDLK